MTVKSGNQWSGVVVTLDATGAKATPSVGPAGVLYVDGVADAAAVTISGANPYKWTVTLPALTAGQIVSMYITATVSTIATAAVVAEEAADTKLVSDAVTLAATQGAITWGAQRIVDVNTVGGIALTIQANGTGGVGLAINGDTPILPVLATPTNITAGTITTATSVTNPVDVGSISGDSTAANNLELQYDGTGLTGVTFPASQAQVSAVMTTAQVESYAADGAAATPAQMLYMILQLLSEKTVVGTTLTVKKLDGSATAMTFTLNDGTTPTSITRTT